MPEKINTIRTQSVPLYLQPPSVSLLVFAAALYISTSVGRWPVYWRSPLLGGILVAAGLMLVIWARLQFRRFGTTLFVGRDSADLVAEGPFRYSRNPMYIGVLTALLGLGLYVGTLPVLLAAPVDFLILRFFHIPREERMLLERFGDRYRNYCNAVRRWL